MAKSIFTHQYSKVKKAQIRKKLLTMEPHEAARAQRRGIEGSKCSTEVKLLATACLLDVLC